MGKYTLSELVDFFIPGDWGNEVPSEETPFKVSCIRGADFIPCTENNISGVPIRYVSLHSFNTKRLQEGDIVIEKSGGSPTQSTGRVLYISKELIENRKDIVCSNFCVAFRVKKGWDPFFVYLLWQQYHKSGVFFNFEGKTSGIRNLQLENALSSIPVKHFDFDKQVIISNFFKRINHKLTVSREMIKSFESLAKQLYDYWFVQFDFPDDNNHPYKTFGGKMVWNEKLKREIPESWNETYLGTICDMYQPKTLGLKELKDNGKYRVYGANGQIGRYNKYNHENSEIAMSCRGNSCGILNRTMPLSWITGNAMVIKPKDNNIHNEYIKQALNYTNINGVITGSGQPQITREDLSKLTLLNADSSLIYRYSKFISPIVEQSLRIRLEIEKLLDFETTLLSLLMNGQVTIE